jgi:hypothetical protein
MNNKLSKYICIILITAIFFYSCTFTYKKPDSDNIDTFYSRINNYGKKFEAILFMNNQESYKVKNLFVQVDSTSYISYETNIFYKIRTSEIQYIEFRDQVSGAVGGLLFGLLGGLVIGLSGIALLMDDNEGHSNLGPAVAIIYGPTIGSVLGLLIGGIREDRKIFIINQSYN